MGAIYYKYNSGNDVFLNGISVSNPVSIEPAFSVGGSPTIITDIGIETNETMQFFMSFDDIIHYMHFGKGMGNLVVSGVAFMDCGGSLTGLSRFYSYAGPKRGEVIKVSVVPNIWFKGPLVSTSSSITGDPETMANFTMRIAITEHSMSKGTTSQTKC